MNPILRNILAVIAGLVIGSLVNMAIVMISSSITPLPEGVNPMDPESVKENIHLYSTMHFIWPFLAHAIGALIGAFFVTKIAASHQMILALIIGAFFLLGGITASFMIPAPGWFIALDLIAAYIPMAWLGWRLAR